MRTLADITLHGPRQLLSAFRKRLLEELQEDAPDVKVTGSGARSKASADAQTLTFKLDAANGVPFPELVAVSAQYPDCVAVVQWTQGHAQGETTLQNGQVKEASRGFTDTRVRGHQQSHGQRQLQGRQPVDGQPPSDRHQQHGRQPLLVRLSAEGRLRLALALDIAADGIVGYCATADAETYFKLRGAAADATLWTIGGAAMQWDETWPDAAGTGPAQARASASAMTPPIALTRAEQRTLEKLAAGVRAEWLWYAHAPEEETIVERQRYAEAARPVSSINVKSRKFSEMPTDNTEKRLGSNLTVSNLGESNLAASTLTVSTLAPGQLWIADVLENTWARPSNTEPA